MLNQAAKIKGTGPSFPDKVGNFNELSQSDQKTGQHADDTDIKSSHILN